LRITEILLERHEGFAFPLRDISFIPGLGIICCFVSKNASSFLKTYLSCLASGKPYSKPQRNPHMPANTGFQGVEELGHSRMSDMLEDGSIPKVILGRHPISRLESAFRSRVKTWQRETWDSHDRADWIRLRQQIAGRAFGRHGAEPLEGMATGLDWNDLVEYVSHTLSGDLDRHLVPQTYFAATSMIDYDVIGTLEQIDEFLDDISELTGKKRLEVTSPRINASQGQAGQQIVSTEAQVQAIQKRYRADFSFFGYTA